MITLVGEESKSNQSTFRRSAPVHGRWYFDYSGAVKNREPGLDLVGEIRPEVLEHHRPKQTHVVSIDGLADEFFEHELFLGERLSRRVRAEQNWFEKLVRHAPTVGTFYESLLRDILREVLPAKLRTRAKTTSQLRPDGIVPPRQDLMAL